MKTFFGLIIFLTALVLAIKFVEPVNDLARTHLPEPVLEIIGEKPKNLLEKGIDKAEQGLKDIGEAVKNTFK